MQWRYNTENHLQQTSTLSNRIHRTWQYRHDERGRIIEVIDPAGASLRPGDPEDGMAQPASPSASMTDKPAGRVMHVTDDFGRPARFHQQPHPARGCSGSYLLKIPYP